MKQMPPKFLSPLVVLLLAMTSLHCYASTNSSTTVGLNVPSLDLVLPEPLKADSSGVVFSVQSYATILQIYNGYILWSDNYENENRLLSLADEKLSYCTERLSLKDESITLLSDDRDHAYQLYNTERNSRDQAETRSTIKMVLISGGVGLVGVAVGLLIGIFAL